MKFEKMVEAKDMHIGFDAASCIESENVVNQFWNDFAKNPTKVGPQISVLEKGEVPDDYPPSIFTTDKKIKYRVKTLMAVLEERSKTLSKNFHLRFAPEWYHVGGGSIIIYWKARKPKNTWYNKKKLAEANNAA